MVDADPILEARIAVLERTVEALVAALKQPAVDPTQGEDGVPRRWLPLRDAAQQTGYSSKWLRTLVKRGKAQGRYRGPHLMVAVDTVPAREVG
jgi:hypothetical protein